MGLCRAVQGCAGLCRAVRGYVGLCRVVQGCVGLCGACSENENEFVSPYKALFLGCEKNLANSLLSRKETKNSKGEKSYGRL